MEKSINKKHLKFLKKWEIDFEKLCYYTIKYVIIQYLQKNISGSSDQAENSYLKTYGTICFILIGFNMIGSPFKNKKYDFMKMS